MYFIYDIFLAFIVTGSERERKNRARELFFEMQIRLFKNPRSYSAVLPGSV